MNKIITKFKNLSKEEQLSIINKFVNDYYEGIYFKEYVSIELSNRKDLNIETVTTVNMYKDTSKIFFEGYVTISNDVLIQMFLNYIEDNKSILHLLSDWIN